MENTETQQHGSAKELTPDEIDRLEWVLGTIEAKRVVGEKLTPPEDALRVALDALTQAEREARDAFSGFYSTLPIRGGDAGQVALPTDVAAQINRWIEARRTWDGLVTAFLNAPPPAQSAPVRTGPRLKASLPDSLRIPTALPARDMLSLLFAPHLWQADTDGGAIRAQRGETHVQIDCDDITGLSPEQAIRQIAKHGASVAQTFFGLVGLWMERNPGASHETYMTVYASDLLRYQNRKETQRGGYHSEDILAKGRDLYLLSRISVPTASVTAYEGGRREARTLSLGRLLSLESLEVAQETAKDASGKATSSTSIVRFRYHLGREVYAWVGGNAPQYTRLSGKLLTYHPVRQKYQVLLGFCLGYYDRVNRKNSQEVRRIGLPALLNLAAIEVPPKRIAEFFSSLEEALEDLSRDGVIPGLRLQKPANWTEMLARRDTRAIIAGSYITFPRLDADALPTGLKRSLSSVP